MKNTTTNINYDKNSFNNTNNIFYGNKRNTTNRNY